ncbi:MAG TPA: hypothetical protein VJ817_11675 [Gemmatimonadales bacterium]|nr:hypothetical protein [Gemmatimonadales bacterium]
MGDRVLIVDRGRTVENIGGARKRRLRVEDLHDAFNRLRSTDLVDESAAEMVRRLYLSPYVTLNEVKGACPG